MNAENWREILLLGLGITISPVPMMAAILVMMGKKGFSNGLAFVLGWALALGILTCGGPLLFQGMGTSGEPGTGSSVAKVIFGSILIFLAYRFWKKYKPNEPQPVPKWMAVIDKFGTGKSILLGGLLLVSNIKNLPLAIEGASAFAKIESRKGMFVTALCLYITVATIGVAAPVVAAILGKEKASQILQNWKHWLQTHNAIILCVIFSLLGLRAIVRGITALL